jgi:uncharacterized protein
MVPMPFTNLSLKDKQIVLKTARHAVQYGLAYQKFPRLELTKYSVALQQHAASFVTLKETSRLRGCVGTLEAKQPLIQDVAEHAFAAAFNDPRFPPINHIEEPMVHISVSILSPPEPLSFANEDDFLAQLKPGEDGVILRYDGQQATFLPNVWQQLQDPAEFINQLKLKAGWQIDFWSSDIKALRYSTTTID